MPRAVPTTLWKLVIDQTRALRSRMVHLWAHRALQQLTTILAAEAFILVFELPALPSVVVHRRRLVTLHRLHRPTTAPAHCAHRTHRSVLLRVPLLRRRNRQARGRRRRRAPEVPEVHPVRHRHLPLLLIPPLHDLRESNPRRVKRLQLHLTEPWDPRSAVLPRAERFGVPCLHKTRHQQALPDRFLNLLLGDIVDAVRIILRPVTLRSGSRYPDAFPGVPLHVDRRPATRLRKLPFLLG